MKKYLTLLLLLLTVLLCVACKKEGKEIIIEPFDLKDEYYQESKIIDLEQKDLEKMIEDDESFVMYIYLPGCSSCAEFKEVLQEFQKDNKLVIYSTQIKIAHAIGLKEKIPYAPSFAVYKEGKLIAYLDAMSDDDLQYYMTSDDFKTWLTEYINLK